MKTSKFWVFWINFSYYWMLANLVIDGVCLLGMAWDFLPRTERPGFFVLGISFHVLGFVIFKGYRARLEAETKEK